MCVGRFGVDPRWSETGDRYLLKLFRDYVFHQVYDDGNPAVDLGHVVDTLNKVRSYQMPRTRERERADWPSMVSTVGRWLCRKGSLDDERREVNLGCKVRLTKQTNKQTNHE